MVIQRSVDGRDIISFLLDSLKKSLQPRTIHKGSLGNFYHGNEATSIGILPLEIMIVVMLG